MKIIHCADIHADSKMGTHFTKEQASQRREEIVDTFAKMVKYAEENDVRAIIIAGDLFDTKETQQKSIKKRISYIIGIHKNIDFIYVRGNHDEDVYFAVEENLPNLKRFSKKCWDKIEYDNVSIYGREFGEKIPNSVYSDLVVDPKKINIVVMHGQVAEYKPKEGAPIISLPSFINKDIDYLALGHIHEYKLEHLDKRCSWCYSGCLEGRGFDEAGEKGFVLLTIDDKKINTEFIPISKRNIHEVIVELNGSLDYSDVMSQISEKVSAYPSKDIVEVILQGEISEDTEIEVDSYQQTLSSDFYCIRIKDKTQIKIDYEKYENDVSLKGEFIRLVKARSDLREEEKVKTIITGIKALAGRLD